MLTQMAQQGCFKSQIIRAQAGTDFDRGLMSVGSGEAKVMIHITDQFSECAGSLMEPLEPLADLLPGDGIRLVHVICVVHTLWAVSPAKVWSMVQSGLQ